MESEENGDNFIAYWQDVTHPVFIDLEDELKSSWV